MNNLMLDKEKIDLAINEKINFYNDMLLDEIFCFENFDKYDFWEIENLIKLTNLSSVPAIYYSAESFNDALIDNVLHVLKKEFGLNGSITALNYPRHIIRLNSCCDIDLFDKLIDVYNQECFSENIVEKMKEQIEAVVEQKPADNILDWIKQKYGFKLLDLLVYRLHKKECTLLYQQEVKLYNKEISQRKDWLKDEEKLLMTHKEEMAEVDDIIKMLKPFGYKLNVI